MRSSLSLLCVLGCFIYGVTSRAHHEYQDDNKAIYPEIHEVHVESIIKDHFKRTHIRFELRNHVPTANHLEFSITLPEVDSFVDELELKWNGKHLISQMKNRNQTREIYRTLLADGKTVAFIEKDKYDSNKYNVHVNMEENSECSVTVTTAEIIPRVDKKFDVVTRFEADTPVRKIYYYIKITDRRPIKNVTLQGPGNELTKNTADLPNSVIRRFGNSDVVVEFSPDFHQIKQMFGSTKENRGPSDFHVVYDIDESVQYGVQQIYRNRDQDQWFRQRNIRPFFPPRDVVYHSYPLPPVSVSGASLDDIQKISTIKSLKNALRSISNLEEGDLLRAVRTLHLVTPITSLIVTPHDDVVETFTQAPTTESTTSIRTTTKRSLPPRRFWIRV